VLWQLKYIGKKGTARGGMNLLRGILKRAGDEMGKSLLGGVENRKNLKVRAKDGTGMRSHNKIGKLMEK